MGTEAERLRDILAKTLRAKMHANQLPQVEWATIVSVQEDKTCTVQMAKDKANSPIDGILTTLYGNLNIKPKKDSDCLVAHVLNEPGEGFLIWCAEIEQITINGDEHGGIGKTKEIAERLKRLEDSFEALQNKFNAHNHPYVNVAAPAVTSITTSLSFEVVAPKTTQAYISNDTIQHGEG